MAVLKSVTLVILVVVSFLTSGVLRLVSILLLDQPNLWASVGSLFLPIGLDVVIFAMLFRFVPARFVHWDAVLRAAIFGAIGWELAKAGLAYYLNNLAGFQFIYGGIATTVVLLFWANLVAAIFLLSAEFCARLNEWIIRQDTDQPSTIRSYSIAIRNGLVEVRSPEERRIARGK
ncbi:MAG: YihY/virulence factor BrkB family protein [Chloroflexi bacterium]|nr:YihY/virulence factor BrkB family protein [Chloroflexota bacterium]